LLGKGGDVKVSEALAGKDCVGLYFSAHWCPPCRGFTPKLAEVYNGLVSAGKSFEIVFVSSDKSEDQFNEYCGEMPWLALPYSERAAKQKLSQKFKVQGIPMLILLDGSGKLLTKQGREAVASPEKFPWKPPTIADVLGSELVSSGGNKVSVMSLKEAGTYIALYFSAHWCGPCRGFTPELVKTYNALKAAGKPFEIVFVSSDRDEASFAEYFGTMPWLALPFDKREAKAELSSLLEVEGIPTLVMLDPSLKVLNRDGRGRVGSDPKGAEFPWAPRKVSPVDEVVEELNSTPTLLVLMEEAADDWDDLEAALEAVAEEALGSVPEEEDPPFTFAHAQETGGIAQRIRQLLKLGKAGATPEMVLLDLPDDGAYYKHEGAVTKEAMAAMLQGYKAGSLTKLSLKPPE